MNIQEHNDQQINPKQTVLRLQLAAGVLTFGYLAILFVKDIISCGPGGYNCSLQNFGIIFPVYVLLSPWIGIISFGIYIALFIISALMYTGVAYHFTGIVASLYFRFFDRPKFNFKRIKVI